MDHHPRESRNIVRGVVAREQNQHPGNGGRKPMAQHPRRPSGPGRMVEDQRQHHAEENWAERRLAEEIRELSIWKKPEPREAEEEGRQDDQRGGLPSRELWKSWSYQR